MKAFETMESAFTTFPECSWRNILTFVIKSKLKIMLHKRFKLLSRNKLNDCHVLLYMSFFPLHFAESWVIFELSI